MLSPGFREGTLVSLDELRQLEGRLQTSAVAHNERNIRHVTMIEVVDETIGWSQTFTGLDVAHAGADLDDLIETTPLLVCAIAAEIGYRFEGVGTTFWEHFDEKIGCSATLAQRQRIADAFRVQAARYDLSRPTQSGFSEHFSIISWPIANALLPCELIEPVTRMLARAPLGALPGKGRSANFASLRAWASAAEGARLSDWLRFEAPTGRVLTAILTENQGGVLPQASYERLRDALAEKPEALLATRTARLRVRAPKPTAPLELTFGRLAVTRDSTGVRMFATWPPLPAALFDEARATARSAGWRPRLWNAGSLLHPDTALSPGPFALALHAAPGDAEPAYPGVSDVFSEGSDAAAALAARSIDWREYLVFEPNEERTHAEQRFTPITDTVGYAWLGARTDGAALQGLRKLGSACGYAIFEADLSAADDRAILVRAGLLSTASRSVVARHPIDAIGAPQGVVRPGRPFLIYKEGDVSGETFAVQRLSEGTRIASTAGDSGLPSLRAETAPPTGTSAVNLILFERDSLFEALTERRLQLRVESRLPLVDVPVVSELFVEGRLLARGRVSLPELPTIVPANSELLAPLYEDGVRDKLLVSCKGELRFTIGRSAVQMVALQRRPASVDWINGVPHLLASDLETKLVAATGRQPHRFSTAPAIAPPSRGAMAYGLQLSDGRIADPIQIFCSTTFSLGDFSTHFGDDIGSRRMFESGRGIGDFARGSVAWARGLCSSLQSLAAKARIVRQFEEPLVIGLCGRSWWHAEQSARSNSSDPHHALWTVALKRGLAPLPEGIKPGDADIFARAFRRHARSLDPLWPSSDLPPSDGAMDDALNAAFAEALLELHARGALLDIDENDCDFGSPAEDWEYAASEALRIVRHPSLVERIAPSEGGLELSRRSYGNVSLPELAEDLSVWTHRWALPRGHMDTEVAVGALQLWLSPATCDEVDRVAHALAVDPFVARATRYASLRLATEMEGASA